MHAEECISIGDRILEVNGTQGDAYKLLELAKVSDTLVLLVQPAAMAEQNEHERLAALETSEKSPVGEQTWKDMFAVKDIFANHFQF